MSENVGQWIKTHRERLSLSQDDLAARMQAQGIDIGRAAISHWETGRNPLPLDNVPAMKALAASLEVPIPDLLMTVGYDVGGAKMILDEKEQQLLSALRQGNLIKVLVSLGKFGLTGNAASK